MKKILFGLCLVMVAATFNVSCSKNDASENAYALDKNFFFTINFGGKSFTSYGCYAKKNPDFIDAPFLGGLNSQVILYGDTTRILYISVHNESAAGFPLGNCDAGIKITKKGSTILGTYNLEEYPAENRTIKITGGKLYLIEVKAGKFNLTNMPAPGTPNSYIEGNFQCNLVEILGSATTIIPATGTFRLRDF